MNLQRYFWGFQNGGKFRRYSGKGEQSYRILLYQKCYLICKRGRNYCQNYFLESKKKRGESQNSMKLFEASKNERRIFDRINSWGKIDTDYSFREILIEVKEGRGAFHPKFVKKWGKSFIQNLRQQPRGKFRTCTSTWARLIKISCKGQFDTQFAMKATEYNHTEFMTKKKTRQGV